MVYLFLSLSVLAFLICLRLTGLIPRVLRVVELSSEAAGVMRDATLDDDQKEELVQQAATRLIGNFCLIVVFTAICLLVPLGVAYAGIFAELYSQQAALAGATNWVFLVVSTVVAVGLYRVVK